MAPGRTAAEAEDEGEDFDDLDADVQEGSAFSDLSEEDQLAILAFDNPQGVEHFGKNRPPAIPQPDRARSAPDLPKVKSNAFTRFFK